MRHHTSSHYTAYMVGGSLICLGVAFLLDQQGIIALQDIWQYWPLLLIIGGAIRIIDPETPRDVASGAWTLLIGVWLFANFEGWFGMDFDNSWPLLLIGWGVSLLLRPMLQARFARKNGADTANQEHRDAH